MALLQVQVALDARRCLLLIQAMIAGVPPYITGPTSSLRCHFAFGIEPPKLKGYIVPIGYTWHIPSSAIAARYMHHRY